MSDSRNTLRENSARVTTRHGLSFAAILALAPLAMGARGCDYAVVGNDCADAGANKKCATGTGCDYGGKHYVSGASFQAKDLCNSCSCGQDGKVNCTTLKCGDGASCGGLTGKQCPSDQYCEFGIDAKCGAGDATGSCAQKPQICTANYAPVCGCDGMTYGNACSAAGAGVSVASKGECGTNGSGCDYNGTHYATGDAFPATDGCNKCSCGMDGKIACTMLACGGGSTCGGIAGLGCDKGQYCDYRPDAKCGAADQSGTCAPMSDPSTCTQGTKPVCGCDGISYENACLAAAVGVAVSADGMCPPTGGGCDYQGKHTDVGTLIVGGICMCKCGADGAFCAVSGCTSAPSGCEYAGKPYPAGSSFPDTAGCNICTCSPDGTVTCTEKLCTTPQPCGGIKGGGCPMGDYCNYGPDAMCGAADATGTCTPTPQVCDTIYAPVCGCDGKTYSSDCNAAGVGVSVAYKGECMTGDGCIYNGTHYAVGDSFMATDGCNKCSCQMGGGVACTKIACPAPTCGGIAGKTCPDGQYCDFPIATMCGSGDQTGTCMDKPQVCTTIYMPVCGCDGKTYSSDCVAAGAGVSVASTGACK